MKKKEFENIIYSDFCDEEDYKEGFEEWCEINELDPKDCDIHDYIADANYEWLNAEIANLKADCGDILAIADLGLWNGRRSAYKVIRGGKVNGIISNTIISGYDVKVYCDRYNVRGEQHHHDGVNYIEFREIKPNVNIQPLLDRLYNQEEVTREMIRKYTTSLRPKVAKVYGW